jgi:short-subunit dehydrogenase
MPHDPKHVLVTGAGSGIGRALAVEAAARGMTVALCGRRPDALAETGRIIGADAKQIIAADVTLAADRRMIVDRVAGLWGSLDVLVNNAGVVEGGALEDFSDDAMVRTFQTNVVAPMALTRDLMPLLVAAKPSRVVNVGSVFGEIAYPRFACYSASKFALRGFSIALRREWKQKGIGVTYAAPRATRTDAAVAFADLIAKTKMNLDPPEAVARQIWQAVASGQDSVDAPLPERFYILLQRFFPRLIDRSLSQPA